MIKKSFNAEIVDALTRSAYFTQYDFVISTAPRRDRMSLTIHYRYEPRYQLTASVPPELANGKHIPVTVLPGSVAEQEKTTCYGKDDLLGRIAEWADDLRAELKAIPLSREFEAERARVEALVAQLADLPDEYFTRAEADELRARLEDLEARFVDHLNATVDESAANNERLEHISREFDMLKSSVDVLSKPSWATSFLAKCARWLRDPANRSLIVDGADVARKLLE